MSRRRGRRTLALLGTGRANTVASGAPTEPPVADSPRPDGDLALLTAALDDPGTDLLGLLTVVADHLTTAMPSFLGVTITVVLDGVAVTLGVHDADLAPTAKASLNLPFSVLVPDDTTNGTMVFHAADVGGFPDLAVAVMKSAADGEQILAGGQLASPRSERSMRVTGLAEFSVRNQAIGVLIDQGHTPDQAWMELRRATRDDATLDETAQHTLDHLTRTTNRAEASAARTPRTRLPARRARTRAVRGADLIARERDVLRLLVAGFSTVAIAAALLVLPGTVGDHIHSIMIKLGADSRVETVAISVSENVLGTG